MPNQDIQDINYTDPNSIVPEAYKSETIDLNQPQQEQYENANVVSPIVQEIQPELIVETTATVSTQFEGITAEELEGYDPTEDNTAEAIAIINGSFGAPTNEVVDQVINDIITPVEETPKEEVKQAMPTNLDFEIENVDVNRKEIFDDVKTYVNERYELTNNNLATMTIQNEGITDMLYGNSQYKVKGEENTGDIFAELSSYKKLGKSIDVYLPTSNMAVRIYEFENDVIKENIINDILRDYESTTRAIHSPFNRQFMNRVFDNTVVLTSDSDRVGRAQLERLANKDMNLLLLAVAALLMEVGTETGRILEDKEAPITIEHTCEKCGAEHNIKLHPKDLLKDQYTKEMITMLDTKYSVDRTFDVNLKESFLAKAYNIRLQNSITGKLTEIKLKEASYVKYTTLEDRLNTYILNKWKDHDLFKSISTTNEFSLLTDKDKLTYLTGEAVNSIDMNIDAMKFLTDQVSASNLLRMDRITITNTKTNIVEHDSTILELLDRSEERTFDMIANLPQTLLSRMKNAIDTMDDKSINNISHTWTCERKECGAVNTSELNPKQLIVFITAETTRATL